MRRVAGLLMVLALSGCDPKPPPSPAPISSFTPDQLSPHDRFEALRPNDEARFLQAFSDHDAAVNEAPNAIAKAAVRHVEDPKLCSTIDRFKKFDDWTAQVKSIGETDEGQAEITLSLNGSLAGYLITGHVVTLSPLYPVVTSLKDGLLDGSYVTISGTVLRSKQGAAALENLDDPHACTGRSNFDVKFTAIEPL